MSHDGQRDVAAEVYAVVQAIARQKNRPVERVGDELELRADLGFDSLDLAQLVSTLEMRLGVDPFATALPITTVRTAGDLRRCYTDMVG